MAIGVAVGVMKIEVGVTVGSTREGVKTATRLRPMLNTTITLNAIEMNCRLRVAREDRDT